MKPLLERTDLVKSNSAMYRCHFGSHSFHSSQRYNPLPMPVFQEVSFCEEIGPLRLHSDPTQAARQAHRVSQCTHCKDCVTCWKTCNRKGYTSCKECNKGQGWALHLEQDNPGCMHQLGNEKLESSCGKGPGGPG